ncbi:MAG: cytochrome C biogenesis protein [Gammaproteobacteria bacterium RIFCSPLOWO2_02_FULL_61_13]|nr:MAG: cytochrome C biogenesis protein [Gammaproteobacteria bacterium RIFCSPLOWO2_02_FULL_61_13]
MEFKDYYQVMGVKRDATQDEIKRAYRKLARKFHPDVSKEANAEARFKEVGEAYEVLKEPEKRAAYDQLGANWKGGQEFRPPPGWDDGFEFRGSGDSGGAAGDHSDFFETLFGRAGAGARQARHGNFNLHGEDHHAKVAIDLEDSYTGPTRTITLKVPQLDAQGHIVTRERVLSVAIPKGIRSGQHIRLAGQGGPGIGEGKPGDLYLQVELHPHRLYRADGRDVYLDLPVAPWEAVLGASVKAPTPEGSVDLRIPPKSRAGSKLRLKGRGLPGNPAGDLYVVLQIALPPANSSAAMAAYRKMAEELPFDPRAEMGV